MQKHTSYKICKTSLTGTPNQHHHRSSFQDMMSRPFFDFLSNLLDNLTLSSISKCVKFYSV